MGALILDASVLIGLLDIADSHHAGSIDDVEAADRAGQELLVPASAYSEALVAFARAGRVREAREAIAAMGITVTPLSATVAERASELRARHERLRLPDAIVLATARELQAELLTYDRRLAQTARKHREQVQDG
ncbi:MAG TPA: PIN domain-containing protein [Solirubrobacteraceae bacterium]|nr:PIN domain-containing protein [Solirubrobacteraceae bacterium]